MTRTHPFSLYTTDRIVKAGGFISAKSYGPEYEKALLEIAQIIEASAIAEGAPLAKNIIRIDPKTGAEKVDRKQFNIELREFQVRTMINDAQALRRTNAVGDRERLFSVNSDNNTDNENADGIVGPKTLAVLEYNRQIVEARRRQVSENATIANENQRLFNTADAIANATYVKREPDMLEQSTHLVGKLPSPDMLSGKSSLKDFLDKVHKLKGNKTTHDKAALSPKDIALHNFITQVIGTNLDFRPHEKGQNIEPTPTPTRVANNAAPAHGAPAGKNQKNPDSGRS